MRNKLIPSIVIILLVMLVLCSCDPPNYKYDGEHPAEYAAANYSFFGLKSAAEDKVLILEEDDYGRTLSLLRTSSWIVKDEYVAIVVVTQSSNETEVQYYESSNIIYCYTDFFEPSEETFSDLFSVEQISQLKEDNDWGKELDSGKTVTKRIVTSDYDAGFVREKEINKIFIELYGDDDNTFYDPLTQYSNGRGVYLIGRPEFEKLDNYRKEYYIVVILPESNYRDPKYIFEEVEDIHNCQEQVLELINTSQTNSISR